VPRAQQQRHPRCCQEDKEEAKAVGEAARIEATEAQTEEEAMLSLEAPDQRSRATLMG
jgi:hypothetical protein